jgi:hypothetical protein
MNIGKLGWTFMVFAALVTGSKKRIATIAATAPPSKRIPAAVKCSKYPATTPKVFKPSPARSRGLRSGLSPMNTGSQRELKPQIMGTRKPHVETIK